MSHRWRVVVASDLSTPSLDALRRACRLAAERRGSVSAVHVALEDETEFEPDEAALILREQLGTTARHHPGVAWDVHVAEGRPFVEIIRYARQVDANLIIVGALGRDARPTPLLGTTAERVARKADRPVLVVRSPIDAPYRRCLVGIDFSQASVSALAAAVDVAPDAALDLVHAFSLTGWKKLHRAGASELDRRELARSIEQNATERLSELLASQGLSRADVAVLVQEGSAATLICRLAKQRHVDLIAVGASGTSALRQVLLGVVAEHAIRDAHCDVLAVRIGAPDFELP